MPVEIHTEIYKSLINTMKSSKYVNEKLLCIAASEASISEIKSQLDQFTQTVST